MCGVKWRLHEQIRKAEQCIVSIDHVTLETVSASFCKQATLYRNETLTKSMANILPKKLSYVSPWRKLYFGHFTEWFDWQYASGDLGNFWYQSGVNALLTWNNSIIHFITTVKCIYSAICSCPDQSIVGRVQGNRTRLFDKIVSYSATSKWRYVIFVKICGSCTVFTTLSWKISCQSRTQNNSMMCPISGLRYFASSDKIAGKYIWIEHYSHNVWHIY